MFGRFNFIKRRSHPKTFHVLALDGAMHTYELEGRTPARELLMRVVRAVDVPETDFFGLVSPEDNYMKWIDLSKPLRKQLPGKSPYTLHFRVQSYPRDHHVLENHNTRHLLFLQVRQDLQQSRLECSSANVTRLVALAVQAEVGDFSSQRCGNGYLSELHSLPELTSQLEEAVMQLHRLNRGKTSRECEGEFLDVAQEEGSYGTHIYTVQDEAQQSVSLAVGPSGIRVLQESTETATFEWACVTKVTARGKTITVHSETTLPPASHHTQFTCSSSQLSHNLAALCMQMNQFYCLGMDREQIKSRLKRFFSFRRSMHRRPPVQRASTHAHPNTNPTPRRGLGIRRSSFGGAMSSSSQLEESVGGSRRTSTTSSKLIVYGTAGLAKVDSLSKDGNSPAHHQLQVRAPSLSHTPLSSIPEATDHVHSRSASHDSNHAHSRSASHDSNHAHSRSASHDSNHAHSCSASHDSAPQHSASNDHRHSASYDSSHSHQHSGSNEHGCSDLNQQQNAAMTSNDHRRSASHDTGNQHMGPNHQRSVSLPSSEDKNRMSVLHKANYQHSDSASSQDANQRPRGSHSSPVSTDPLPRLHHTQKHSPDSTKRNLADRQGSNTSRHNDDYQRNQGDRHASSSSAHHERNQGDRHASSSSAHHERNQGDRHASSSSAHHERIQGDRHASSSSAHHERNQGDRHASSSSQHRDDYHRRASSSSAHRDDYHKHASSSSQHRDDYHRRASSSSAHRDDYHRRASSSSQHRDDYHRRASSSSQHRDDYHRRASSSSAHHDNYHRHASSSSAHRDNYHKRASSSSAHYNGYPSSVDRRRSEGANGVGPREALHYKDYASHQDRREGYSTRTYLSQPETSEWYGDSTSQPETKYFYDYRNYADGRIRRSSLGHRHSSLERQLSAEQNRHRRTSLEHHLSPAREDKPSPSSHPHHYIPNGSSSRERNSPPRHLGPRSASHLGFTSHHQSSSPRNRYQRYERYSPQQPHSSTPVRELYQKQEAYRSRKKDTEYDDIQKVRSLPAGSSLSPPPCEEDEDDLSQALDDALNELDFEEEEQRWQGDQRGPPRAFAKPQNRGPFRLSLQDANYYDNSHFYNRQHWQRKSAHHSSNTQLSQGSIMGSIVSLEHQASLAELSQTSEFDPLVRSLVFESSQTEAGTEL